MLTAISKNTPTNFVAEILQQQHFANTSTNPEGCHMSNFTCQNEVNMANEPLKVEKPVLECSSEMDKLRCRTDTALSPVTKSIVLHTSIKILQTCMDLQDSVQQFLQNPAEKILQICTDSQRSKSWDVCWICACDTDKQ